jgi:hypothetical protein
MDTELTYYFAAQFAVSVRTAPSIKGFEELSGILLFEYKIYGHLHGNAGGRNDFFA